MTHQRYRIIDTRCQCRCLGILTRLYNSYNLQILALIHQILHVFFIVRLIFPDIILTVILIIIRTVHQFELLTQDIIIGIFSQIFRCLDIFLISKLPDHIIQFHLVSESQCIQHKVTDTSVWSEYQHTLMVILRPASCLHLILILIELCILRHLIEHVGAHHRWHHTVWACCRAKSQRYKRLIRIHLAYTVFVLSVNLRCHSVRILYCGRILFNPGLVTVQILLERLQVIGIHLGKHVGHHLHDLHFVITFLLLITRVRHGRCISHHHGWYIKSRALYL